MSKNKIVVRSAKERRFAQIPVDMIEVINSRYRDEERFQETVKSIAELGLYKPIRVNEHRLKKTGKYDLVCGQGRLEAYRQLDMTHIEAEIVDVDEGHALKEGLAENLTRAKKSTIDFARRILGMYERGMSYSELARITQKSNVTIRDYIALMQKGETRLIQGIEQGTFSISFAMQVIESTDSDIQHFLMTEFENGNITARDLGCLTKVLNERAAKGLSNVEMTTTKLKSIIKEKTKQHKNFLAESKIKQNDILRLLECLKILQEDESFVKMTEGLKDLSKPELKGQYEI